MNSSAANVEQLMCEEEVCVCVTSFPLRWYPYSDSRFDTFWTLTASLNGVASPISPLFAETWNPTDKNKRTCKSKDRAHTLKNWFTSNIDLVIRSKICVKLLYSLPSLSVTNVQSDLHNEPPIQMIFFFQRSQNTFYLFLLLSHWHACVVSPHNYIM